MSGSSSKSKSSSTTTTVTTTEQKDERVAATDSAIAVGASNSGTVTVNEIPDGLEDFVTQLVDAAKDAGGQAFELARVAVENSTQSVEAEKSKAEQTSKILLYGLGGLVVIALIAKGGKF